MAQSPDNLIWLDLEMTGLDSMNDYIIEIATIITDEQLNVLEEGPVIAIHTEKAIIDEMDDWNTSHHGKTGLISRIESSPNTMADAESSTLEFIKKYVPAKASPMCGNSICQDRRFMARLMPDLEAYFHYRNLDVSSLKILALHWAPKEMQYSKVSSHIAIEDVRDSIDELKFYREKFFKV